MIIHGRRYWFNKLQRELFELHKMTRGTINLSFGRHEVFISLPSELEGHVQCVYLCCEGVGDPVCQGDIDMCSHQMTPGGFVIYADVRHNVTNIMWIVEYDIDDDEHDD